MTPKYEILGADIAGRVEAVGPSVNQLRPGDELAFLMHKPSRNDLVTLTALLEAKKVVPVINRTYALPDVGRALEYFGQGGVAGKVVISASAPERPRSST